MDSAFEVARNITATVSNPSALALSAKAAYLALAVDSPLYAAFKFSIVFTGLVVHPDISQAAKIKNKNLVTVFIRFSLVDNL